MSDEPRECELRGQKIGGEGYHICRWLQRLANARGNRFLCFLVRPEDCLLCYAPGMVAALEAVKAAPLPAHVGTRLDRALRLVDAALAAIQGDSENGKESG